MWLSAVRMRKNGCVAIVNFKMVEMLSTDTMKHERNIIIFKGVGNSVAMRLCFGTDWCKNLNGGLYHYVCVCCKRIRLE